MVIVIHPQHRILLRLTIFRLISHWNQIPPSGSLRIGNEPPLQAHSALDNSESGSGTSSSATLETEYHMDALRQVEDLLPALTRAEKAQLLRLVVQDLDDAFPGIESTPDVCGGEPCIVRTRIPVWVLEQARRLGASEDELLRSYPTLRAEDLANCWAYVRSHRPEIEEQIRANENA